MQDVFDHQVVQRPEPAEQVLELVLQLVDRAGVLRLLLQQLLPLGAQQFHFLTQLLEFGLGCRPCWGVMRGHALVDCTRLRRLVKTPEYLELSPPRAARSVADA